MRIHVVALIVLLYAPPRADITVTARVSSGNGSVTPPNAKAKEGSDLSVTVTAEKTWCVKKVAVDGANLSNLTKGATQTMGGDEVKIEETTGDDRGIQTMKVTFKKAKKNHKLEAYFKKRTYHVKTDAKTGGTITPAGLVKVLAGENVELKVQADAEHLIDEIERDGVKQESVFAAQEGEFSFKQVREDHTFAVTFFKFEWYKSTFGTSFESLAYHWDKHGKSKGKSAKDYAIDAAAWFKANKSKGTPVKLADGSQGLEFKKSNPGGYCTLHGTPVTFWY